MRFLKTNTATRITVGPFLDKTDGITPETGLTVTNEKLTMVVDSSGVPTLVLDTAPTASAGSNDMVHVSGDDAGFYDLELAAADVNYVGRAILSLTDAANHCPVFHEFMILPANVYDSLVSGSDKLDANAAEIGGTAQTGRDLGASVLLSPGTGTGQVSLSSGAVTVGTNSDKTGYALTAAYDAAKTAATQTSVDTIDGIVDTIISRIVGTLAAGTHNPQSGDAYAIVNNGTYGNSALNTLLNAIAGYVDTEVAAIKAKTDNLPAQPAAVGSQMDLVNAPNATAIAAFKTAIEAAGSYLAIIKAVTDKLGTMTELDGAVYRYTANALEQAPSGSATDPWDTALPAAYAAGTAGYILGTRLDVKVSSIGGAAGAGANAWPITINDDAGDPLPDVDVWISTDAAGANIVASGKTDAFGVAQPTFMLDSGTYYCWRQKTGYNFTNPSPFTVT